MWISSVLLFMFNTLSYNSLKLNYLLFISIAAIMALRPFQVSWAVGNMYSGGSTKPYRPVSRSSMV